MVIALESYVFAVADVSGESNEHDYITVQAADLNEAQEKAEQMAKEEYPQWGKVSIECLESESFSASSGKRMYCPKCKKNRTWMRGFREYDPQTQNPYDFAYYTCKSCRYVKGAESFSAEHKRRGGSGAYCVCGAQIRRKKLTNGRYITVCGRSGVRIPPGLPPKKAESFSADAAYILGRKDGEVQTHLHIEGVEDKTGFEPIKIYEKTDEWDRKYGRNHGKTDYNAESFSGKNWRDASPDAEYQALAKLDPIRDGQYNQGIAHSRVIVNGYEQIYEKYIKPVMAEYPYIRVRMESPMRDNNIIYVLITEQRKVDEKPWPGGTWETIIDRKHTLAFQNSVDLFYWYYRMGIDRLNSDNDYDEVIEAHSENLIRLIFGKYLNEKYGWFDGADEWEEPYPLPQEVAVGAAESFSAEGYKGIPASKIEILKWYVRNGGKAGDFHDLPTDVQIRLQAGNVHELLYQDVNRWLQDNGYNPHMETPDWLSAESFSAECDDFCIKCEGCDTCINDICENAEEEWGREWADFGHLCRICHDKHKEELGMDADSFSASKDNALPKCIRCGEPAPIRAPTHWKGAYLPQPLCEGCYKKEWRAESFSAECVSCTTPEGYWRGWPLCSQSGKSLCVGCCDCNDCRNKWNQLEYGETAVGPYPLPAESFGAETIKPMTIGFGLGIVALFLWGRNR